MITGGSSYDGLTYGAFSGGYKPLRPDELSYDEYGGLGFLASWIPDTHFSERGREARLIRLVSFNSLFLIINTNSYLTFT
jgi:cyanophycinase